VQVRSHPEGVIVVFLQGGPGGGGRPAMQCLFDAARHRVIFVDQRGEGAARRAAAAKPIPRRT
jgi:proline iminopeptidase